MTNESAQTLSGLIEKALQTKEPDPHVLARRLLSKVSPQVQTELALDGLAYQIRQSIHRARCEVVPKAGPSRWRVSLPDGWALLEKCTVEDLEALADDYRQRADAMLAREQEYRELAVRLRASGCVTVGEMWARESESLAA